MVKSRPAKGKATVTFSLEPEVGGSHAAVCGDWNGWDSGADVMEPVPGGGFVLRLGLPTGAAYRFRYLVDGERWENDWSADGYLPNDFGADDCLVDLTGVARAAASPSAPKALAAPARAKVGGAPKTAGSNGSAPRVASSKLAGPKPKVAGPKVAGPKVAGSNGAGPKAAGTKAGA